MIVINGAAVVANITGIIAYAAAMLYY